MPSSSIANFWGYFAKVDTYLMRPLIFCNSAIGVVLLPGLFILFNYIVGFDTKRFNIHWVVVSSVATILPMHLGNKARK